jgi:DNA-binding NtrC family response regulator
MKHAASILLVDDDVAFRHVLSGELERLGFCVASVATGAEALRMLADAPREIVLLDLRLPDMSGLDVLRAVREANPGTEVIMLTGHGSIDTAIASIRQGAFDYVAKPCPLDELEIRIQRALERRALHRRASLLERGLTPPDLGASFVGDSGDFRQLVQLIDRVAVSDSTVLITGETGTGKEMVAKLLHARSSRRQRPFVVVECAALQESLLQSELFGHERGAFTGADRAKPGLFEVANSGTIFLDEIGEVSQSTQVKLLRVLDAATFRRVGGTQEIRVDVRVVAATNRDLPAMVRQDVFREDLYYRLSTINVKVPALRDRHGDVDVLARYFVSLLNERFGVRKRLGDRALEQLRRHAWPGNVRELLHAIEAAIVVCEGSEIEPEHLPLTVRGAAVPSGKFSDAPPSHFPTLVELERTHIELALRTAGGHRSRAAALLGVSERNLYRKIREYRIDDGEGEGEERRVSQRP